MLISLMAMASSISLRRVTDPRRISFYLFVFFVYVFVCLWFLFVYFMNF